MHRLFLLLAFVFLFVEVILASPVIMEEDEDRSEPLTRYEPRLTCAYQNDDGNVIEYDC